MAAAYGMFDSSSGVEDKEMLLFPLLLRLRRRRLKAAKSTTWTKCGISGRPTQGATNIVHELDAEEAEQFRKYRRLDKTAFDK